ncbi:hypothetical protein AZA_89952 [Nitrospirillum viridazoti Y2]|nr:hypothetical protein AZA_89952 [Nitrospirillum amazonense Y2]
MGTRHHRQHALIQARRRAPVDGNLGQGHAAPTIGGGQVQMGEMDGAPHLVGAIPGQEDDGAVGIDSLHRQTLVGRRIAQQGDRGGLVHQGRVRGRRTQIHVLILKAFYDRLSCAPRRFFPPGDARHCPTPALRPIPLILCSRETI